MRREHNEIGNTVDPSLKFWFKGEQGRLIDEISGLPIIVNQNLIEWDNEKSAYLFKKSSSYNPRLCGYCLCDTGITESTMTVVADIMYKESGTNITTVDTYPTRQAAFGFATSWGFTTSEFRRASVTYQKNNNNTVSRRNYVDGVLKFSYEYNMDGSFNRYNGVSFNFTNQWVNDFASWYGKNIRWYNRVLTLEEIAAL